MLRNYMQENNSRKSVSLKNYNDSKTFIEYSNDIDKIYENIEKYNPNKNSNY